jgi:hypothetical protein
VIEPGFPISEFSQNNISSFQRLAASLTLELSIRPTNMFEPSYGCWFQHIHFLVCHANPWRLRVTAELSAARMFETPGMETFSPDNGFNKHCFLARPELLATLGASMVFELSLSGHFGNSHPHRGSCWSPPGQLLDREFWYELLVHANTPTLR